MFHGNDAARHFEDLSGLLDSLQSEACGEISQLKASADRITTCAAFAFEALENGEALAPTVDRLEHDLVDNQRRLAVLMQQVKFITKMRSRLGVLLSQQGFRNHANMRLRH